MTASPELAGILVLIGIVVAAVIYFLHSAKGKAELATLEARLMGHVTQAVSNVLPSNPGAPVVPAATPVPPQVIVIHAPSAPPVAPPAAPTAAPPGFLGVGTTTPGGPGNTTYNPDLYPVPTQYQPWLAAGKPEKDYMGRSLDVQGALIDSGGSAPANADPSQGMWGGDCLKGQTLVSASFLGDGSVRTALMNDPGNALGVTYLLNGAGVSATLQNNHQAVLTQGVTYNVSVSYDGSNPNHPDVARTGIWLRK